MIDGRDFHKAIVAVIVTAFVVGGLVVAGLIYGVPWLWQIIKPWLHSITS